ncbi:MAG: hypothetical protein Q9157_007777 [Trypethelium eluteriae]
MDSETTRLEVFPTHFQHTIMPIVCLITYSCGHYSQRRTERTDRRFGSSLDDDLFPIDEIESRNEPCGLEACADMNRDKLRMALTQFINHAFDVLTNLENKHQDLGHRFYLIREPTLLNAAQNPRSDPWDELLPMAEAAFDTRLFAERRPPRSFVQMMIDETEQVLLQSRETRNQDISAALSQLNKGRCLLCALTCDLNTIEQAVGWLENEQRVREENGWLENETTTEQITHMQRAKDWILTLPETRRAMTNGTMRSTSAVLTAFQPDRFLEPSERRPDHPLREEKDGDEFLPSLAWNNSSRLISLLRVSHAPPGTHETEEPSIDSPNFDPDLTAVPSGFGGRSGSEDAMVREAGRQIVLDPTETDGTFTEEETVHSHSSQYADIHPVENANHESVAQDVTDTSQAEAILLRADRILDQYEIEARLRWATATEEMSNFIARSRTNLSLPVSDTAPFDDLGNARRRSW